jgi:hypothetical protein
MAKFKTHVSWGVFIGVGLVVAGLIFSIFSGVESAIWIFFAVLLGSFLPDLDLDDGVPFQILFGLLGAGFAGLIFFNFYQEGERSLKILFFIRDFIKFVNNIVGYSICYCCSFFSINFFCLPSFFSAIAPVK